MVTMNWKPWLYGLASAFMGGGASAISAMVIDPVTFNLAEGFGKMLSMWAVSGIVSVALYLKQSPLPPPL